MDEIYMPLRFNRTASYRVLLYSCASLPPVRGGELRSPFLHLHDEQHGLAHGRRAVEWKEETHRSGDATQSTAFGDVGFFFVPSRSYLASKYSIIIAAVPAPAISTASQYPSKAPRASLPMSNRYESDYYFIFYYSKIWAKCHADRVR